MDNQKHKKNALIATEEISEAIDGRELAIFLDYDGTLTPIVRHADLAHLSQKMRQTLIALSLSFTTAVISGRDRQDVAERVGVQSLTYAGSHGFDIAGANGEHFENQEAKRFLPLLKQAANALEKAITSIAGAWVEQKRFSVAIHYREAAEGQEDRVEALVDEVQSQFPDLRKTFGKKVFELQPDVQWNKGKALLWLLGKLGLDRPDVVPLYIGDDVTDEDAFTAIANRGIAIAVQEIHKPTAAHYLLKDPGEVEQFLRHLLMEKSRV